MPVPFSFSSSSLSHIQHRFLIKTTSGNTSCCASCLEAALNMMLISIHYVRLLYCSCLPSFFHVISSNLAFAPYFEVMAISFLIPHTSTGISSGTSYSKCFLHTGSFNLSLTNDPNTAQESSAFFWQSFFYFLPYTYIATCT